VKFHHSSPFTVVVVVVAAEADPVITVPWTLFLNAKAFSWISAKKPVPWRKSFCPTLTMTEF